MALLTDEDTYRNDPRDAWLRISLRRPSRQALAVLREVATWREMSADRLDLPRTWIMKDNVLTEIALKSPRTKAELGLVRGVPEKFVNRRGGRELLRAVNHALDTDPAEWPRSAGRVQPAKGPRQRRDTPASAAERVLSRARSCARVRRQPRRTDANGGRRLFRDQGSWRLAEGRLRGCSVVANSWGYRR